MKKIIFKKKSEKKDLSHVCYLIIPLLLYFYEANVFTPWMTHQHL